MPRRLGNGLAAAGLIACCSCGNTSGAVSPREEAPFAVGQLIGSSAGYGTRTVAVSWGAVTFSRTGQAPVYLESVDATPRSVGLEVRVFAQPRGPNGVDLTGHSETYGVHAPAAAQDTAGSRPIPGLEVPAAASGASFPALQLVTIARAPTTGWYGIAGYRIRYRVGSRTAPVQATELHAGFSWCVVSPAALTSLPTSVPECRTPLFDGVGLPPGSSQPDTFAALRTSGLPLP
jgi:hypothetical protein